MTQILTVTCKRDAERFRVLERTAKRFMPDWPLRVIQQDGTGLEQFRGVAPYLQQQLLKLVAHWILDDSPQHGQVLHVDSDMWFDAQAALRCHEHQGVWVYDDSRGVIDRHVWPAQQHWAETNAWLLGRHVEPRSFMLEQRGWWIDCELVELLHERIMQEHGKMLWAVLAQRPEIPFSEYQLYASYAWHFHREAHTWLHRRDADQLGLERDAGRDRPLFACHWTSSIGPTMSIRQRWVDLVDFGAV